MFFYWRLCKFESTSVLWAGKERRIHKRLPLFHLSFCLYLFDAATHLSIFGAHFQSVLWLRNYIFLNTSIALWNEKVPIVQTTDLKECHKKYKDAEKILIFFKCSHYFTLNLVELFRNFRLQCCIKKFEYLILVRMEYPQTMSLHFA